MAALSYLLLPITGLLALALGADARTRFHGLQAIVVGLVWVLALYGAALLGPGATKVVFAIGALGWVTFVVATAAGRDPKLPGVGSSLQRATEEDLRT